MKGFKQNLRIKQIDKKLKNSQKIYQSMPTNGWINDVRTSLGMSMEQMGRKLGISAQGVAEMEKRERDNSISLKSLDDAAKALGLRLTYSFFAPGNNLEQMIIDKASTKAKEIVLKTNKTMALEKQANSKARLKAAIKEKTIEISNKKPKYLWD